MNSGKYRIGFAFASGPVWGTVRNLPTTSYRYLGTVPFSYVPQIKRRQGQDDLPSITGYNIQSPKLRRWISELDKKQAKGKKPSKQNNPWDEKQGCTEYHQDIILSQCCGSPFFSLWCGSGSYLPNKGSNPLLNRLIFRTVVWYGTFWIVIYKIRPY